MSLPFDLDAFVRDFGRPLQLVRSVESVMSDEHGVTLRCATLQFNRRWRDRYGTLVEIGVPDAPGERVTIRIDVLTPYVYRLRMRPGDEVPANDTPMVINDFSGRPPSFAVVRSEGETALETDAFSLRIQHNPFRMYYAERNGKPLFNTLPAAVYQHPPTGESHLDGASITDAWPWFFRDTFPLGFVRDAESGLTQSFITTSIHHDEHFYGFGEKFSTLDKRGQAINLWHANATGNTWPASYKNVPFFLSSQGYGLYVNSAYPIRYHMGDLHHTHYSVHLQDDTLDLYTIYGPSYRDIIARYCEITGKPALPPLWSFGLWMSRMSYREQTEVEAVAAGMREHDIPCDVIHIDTDWFKTPWVNDLTFSSERFPDPAGMVRTLREKGFRITLWQIPYIAAESSFYDEGVANGYFATKDDGTPWHIDGFFGKTAVIDYSNSAAVAWMQGKLQPLFDMGIAAIKTDFGEGAPPDAHYHGYSGLEMHNLYPLLYNKAFWEKTQQATGEGIVWGRSVYAGSQRYPVQWGGDPAALWEDLGNLWHGGLGLGLCGFPFWSVDIGGFGGTPTPELYIRWAEAGLFVSHPRAHGPIHREPWAFGEQAVKIFRKYAQLRYRLMPYVWSTAQRSVETCLPMQRPLLLDWQDDPTVAGIDDQWMFGEALMVAPILDEGTRRKVYLPQGVWYDYWTDEIYHNWSGGRWITVDAPLDCLPLYVRGGSIIPTCADAPHTGAQDWSHLTLDVYHDTGERMFALFDKTGIARSLSCRCLDNHLVIDLGGAIGRCTLRIHGVELDDGVYIDGERIEASPQGSAIIVQADGARQVSVPYIPF
jgi:alpha-D-xyloside xylohydrolase